VLSGVPSAPQRATAGEDLLVPAGRLDTAIIDRAAAAVADGAAPLSRNAYQRQLLGALARDAVTGLGAARDGG